MLSVSRSLLLVLVASVSYSASSQAQFARNQGGALFVMNNSASQNEVISFNRAADGSLQQAGRFATGGRGTGGVTDPLESQGSLTLSQDHTLLFAVNGGSSEISVFQVYGSYLVLVDKEPTAGAEPNAVPSLNVSCASELEVSCHRRIPSYHRAVRSYISTEEKDKTL